MAWWLSSNHKAYHEQIPIQIRVQTDENRIYISNDAILPPGWTADTFMRHHRSVPYNPNIANAFFRAGFIEAWGRGIEKICESCVLHGIPLPEYDIGRFEVTVMFKGLPVSPTPSESEPPKHRQNIAGRCIGGIGNKNHRVNGNESSNHPSRIV
jgi:hypothetical protein